MGVVEKFYTADVLTVPKIINAVLNFAKIIGHSIYTQAYQRVTDFFFSGVMLMDCCRVLMTLQVVHCTVHAPAGKYVNLLTRQTDGINQSI